MPRSNIKRYPGLSKTVLLHTFDGPIRVTTRLTPRKQAERKQKALEQRLAFLRTPKNATRASDPSHLTESGPSSQHQTVQADLPSDTICPILLETKGDSEPENDDKSIVNIVGHPNPEVEVPCLDMLGGGTGELYAGSHARAEVECLHESSATKGLTP